MKILHLIIYSNGFQCFHSLLPVFNNSHATNALFIVRFLCLSNKFQCINIDSIFLIDRASLMRHIIAPSLEFPLFRSCWRMLLSSAHIHRRWLTEEESEAFKKLFKVTERPLGSLNDRKHLCDVVLKRTATASSCLPTGGSRRTEASSG